DRAETAMRVVSGELTPGERHLRDALEGAYPGLRVEAARGVSHATRSADWPTYSGPGLGLAEAEARGQVEVRTDAVVHSILVEGGRARAVVYRDRSTGRDHEAAADLVVLAA